MTMSRTTDSGHIELTGYVIELLKDRFQKHVHFLLINNDEIMLYGVNYVMTKERKKVYDQYINCVSRLCGIARLPNVLLYGADTAGHDLSREFSDVIPDVEERQRFLQKAERNNGIFACRGRNVADLEKETVRRHGLTIEDVISAYPPKDDYNFSQLCRAGEGYMVVFYNHKLMSEQLKPHTDFKSTLYPLPQFDAVEAILVAWHRPFKIT